LAEKWQPPLDTITVTPGFKAGHLHKLLDRRLSIAERRQIHHILEVYARQWQRHPKAAFSGVLQCIAVVVGEQNLCGHGSEESLHRF
jgi:hypothetical protein